MINDGYIDSWFWMNKPERHFVRSVDFSLLQRFLGSPCMDLDSILYGRGTEPKAILCTKRRHPREAPLTFCLTRFEPDNPKNYEIRRYVELGRLTKLPVYYLCYESNLKFFYLYNQDNGTIKTMGLEDFCHWYGSVTGIQPNIQQVLERAPLLEKITSKLLEAELKIKEIMPGFIRGLFK